VLDCIRISFLVGSRPNGVGENVVGANVVLSKLLFLFGFKQKHTKFWIYYSSPTHRPLQKQ
jgi:hypothetical protein